MPKKTVIAAVAILAVAAACLQAAKKKDGKPRAPSEVFITFDSVYQKDRIGRFSTIGVQDPKLIAAIEAFFPNYRNSPSSNVAAGWERGYVVFFKFPNGQTTSVTVAGKGNGPFWTQGRGDFETKGDFKQFAEGLKKRVESSKTKE